MDFLSLAKKRYSCRKYKDLPVSEQDLATILEAARVAPTAHNNQPFKLLVIRSEQALEKIRKAGKIYPSPVVIVVCGDVDEAWQNSYDDFKSTDVDASIATDHMMLAATDLGLDSLWICWFDRALVRREFDLPDNLTPINILLIGYGEKEPKPADRHDAQRKALDQIVEYL